MLMENIDSTCTLGIRVRAASHQQEQVSCLTTKTLFRPQQMHRERDFSYRSFFFFFCWGASFSFVLVDCRQPTPMKQPVGVMKD